MQIVQHWVAIKFQLLAGVSAGLVLNSQACVLCQQQYTAWTALAYITVCGLLGVHV
jgi:hypothetical protein